MKQFNKTPRHIGKKTLDQVGRTNFHIGEYKNSKIYLAHNPFPVMSSHGKQYTSKDDVHILNSLFSNLFACDLGDQLGDLQHRLNIISWGAEGMVILEGKNPTISKDLAKEVSLALHLNIPVWVMRDYVLLPVAAVIKDWQGSAENETRNNAKWATIITEGTEIPVSPEITYQSALNKQEAVKN